MEAVFDNETNVLNAQIRVTRDNSVLYSIETPPSLWGRKPTVLKDANPAPGDPRTAGVIHWRKRMFEVRGQRKPFSEIKTKTGMFSSSRSWKWSSDRKGYSVTYELGQWKASLHNRKKPVARFTVPFRPHLFSKPDPVILHLTKTALAEDEVFLLLILIYSESKRQDQSGFPTRV
ncbi:hypothetical protein BD779DRAFT_1803493 [Infundibulicybe gibba]|nr:hypothetical protein BD779DRAFT_1803493 [Infundibulicybe gibba]